MKHANGLASKLVAFYNAHIADVEELNLDEACKIILFLDSQKQETDKLFKALEFEALQKELPSSVALMVDDLKDRALPYLTAKTIDALNVKSNMLTELRADSSGRGYVYAQCVYLGKRVPISKVEDGIKELAEILNKLGNTGKIKSALSHFIKYDLYVSEIGKEQETVILCYPLVDLETYEEIQKDLKAYGGFTEGGCP